VLSQEDRRKSWTLTVESSEDVANLRSEGEKETHQQRSLWAWWYDMNLNSWLKILRGWMASYMK
jgi:hypothetical protein